MPFTESLERSGEPFGSENGRIKPHDRALFHRLAPGVGVIMAPGFGVSGLVSAIGDAVVVSDPEGPIIVWNPASERIFGFSEPEALGQSLEAITPDRHRQRHWEGYQKTMRTGVTKHDAEILRVPRSRQASFCFDVGKYSIEFGRSATKSKTGRKRQ